MKQIGVATVGDDVIDYRCGGDDGSTLAVGTEGMRREESEPSTPPTVAVTTVSSSSTRNMNRTNSLNGGCSGDGGLSAMIDVAAIVVLLRC